MKILIIEDDREIVEAISLAFRIRWPEATLVSTHLGGKGVDMVETEAPDLIILDLGLPDISGFDVLKQVRLFSSTPVLILTVRADEVDIVKGLELGADDYVVKPFKQLELLARVKALLRRAPGIEDLPLVCGPLRYDSSTFQFFRNEIEIKLTRTESQILQHLMTQAGHVVTYSNLAEAVWGEDYPGATDSLKVYIRRLREKIEDDASNPQLILTKASIGYLLVKQE